MLAGNYLKNDTRSRSVLSLCPSTHVHMHLHMCVSSQFITCAVCAFSFSPRPHLYSDALRDQMGELGEKKLYWYKELRSLRCFL